MPLKVHSRMYVASPGGHREIQLCVGDITHLEPQDRVDVIFISAFVCDYAAVKGTVVGALNRNLGLSVWQISCKNKKEDLRKNFNCWISDALPYGFPYKQLLCYEKPRYKDGDLASGVQDMFRALMPIFNNANKSVITPILGAGNQRGDSSQIFQTMILTAISWMQIGLPLQTFKIVIYSRDGVSFHSKTDADCPAVFEKIKARVEKQTFQAKKVKDIVHDIFLIYSDEDADLANTCRQLLSRANKGINLTSVRDLDMSSDKWQSMTYSEMLKSMRVVPLMTEGFARDSRCIDQYNIGLCANRCVQRPLMAPLSIDRLLLPAYMSLVQWINCRPRDMDLLKAACRSLAEVPQNSGPKRDVKYDVFISYSHQNLHIARTYLQQLQQVKKRTIFFDYDALKTGESWQQTLYQAIDQSQCVLALISPQYMASKVCREELSLALARYLAKDADLQLIAVALDELEVADFTHYVPMVTVGEATPEVVVSQLQKFWSLGERGSLLAMAPEPLDIDQLREQQREQEFHKHYSVSDTGHMSLTQSLGPPTFPMGHVFVSHTARDEKYMFYINQNLKKLFPEMKLITSIQDNDLQRLEGAACIVVILSPWYLNSAKDVEEFNIILSHIRSGPTSQMYVLTVGQLPSAPTYLHLVDWDTCLHDEFWRDLIHVSLPREGLKQLESKFGEKCFPDHHVLALNKAVCDLSHIIVNNRYRTWQQEKIALLHDVTAVHRALHHDDVTTPITTIPEVERGEDDDEGNANRGFSIHGDNHNRVSSSDARTKLQSEVVKDDMHEPAQSSNDSSPSIQRVSDESAATTTEQQITSVSSRHSNETHCDPVSPKGTNMGRSRSCTLL